MRVKFGMLEILVLMLLAMSCKDRHEARGERASAPPPKVLGAETRSPVPTKAAPSELRDFDHDGDEGAGLARVGSLPAWSAVTERDRLLERRSQLGAVHGLLLEHEEPGLYRLVDRTVGQGALSIPIDLPDEVHVVPPLRLIAWGAWQLRVVGEGGSPEWVWKATRAERLADEPGPEFSPGMYAREKDPPEDLLPASKASRRGGAIAFTVVEAPERVGDGWLIADSNKAEASARLLLPGEEESYGSQSRPGASERWQLEVGQRYWLEIGRFRPASGDSLPVYQARTVPFVPSAAAR